MTSTQQMFNPSLEKYETLKEMMTEREDELESILGRLKSTQVKGTSRSFVVIGQRGMGKTHFLMLLYHEIKKRKNLKNKYVSLKFSEEEYSIDSLAYFFIRILEELKNECGSQEEKERIKEFIDLSVSLDDKELVNQSSRFLEEMFQKHEMKMVLCADNINRIFDNISSLEKTGLKHLRSILQSKDYLLIIGAAPTFFKEIQNHDEPFYNYFEIIRLPPLSLDGIEELFKKLAGMENNKRIIEEFDTLKPRIKTIIHFTSGVPRLVRMLYYVIANSEITEVTDSLEKLLDELTPYYQARMAQLSPQQQKIIDTMALLDGASTPTEIAKAGRIERPTVNAQLKKLVDTGFVHLVQQKRRKWRRYDITERMFRIWREMRRAKSGNRVKYLADFLKAFYTKDEFKLHKESIDEKFSHSLQNGKISDALKYVKEYEFMKDIIPHEMLPDFECGLIDKYIQLDELKKAEVELNFIKDLKSKRKMPKEFDERVFKLEMKKIEKALENKPEDVSNHFEKGWLLFQKNKYKEAIKEYDKVLEIDPKNEYALLIKATVAIKLGKLKDAITICNKALKINPKNEDALLLKGKSIGGTGNHEKALTEFEKVLKINPKNENAQYWKASTFFNLKKYEEAINEYEKLLKINPKNENAQHWKARAFFSLKKYEEAIKESNKVLEINPKNEDALLMKGRLFGSLEKYKEALVEIEKILKINPKNENAQYWKARAFFSLEKYEKAIKEFEKVIKIYPKNEDAQYWKARALQALEKYEEAIKEFEKVLKINPENEDVLLIKASVAFTLGKHKDAINDYNKASKINPKNENAYYLKALVIFDLEKYEKAIKEFNKVLEINPKNEDAQHWKARAVVMLEKYEEAIKEFDKVLEINPKNEDALSDKAVTIFDLEKYEDAIKEFENILKIYPKNEDARYWKALSFCHLGRYEDAIGEFKIILELNSENEKAMKYIGICILLDNDHESFLTWFDKLESQNKQFNQIFTEGWHFNYDFERENAINFLKEAVSYKNRSNEFLKFWDDLLRFTVQQILYYSTEDFKVKNFGSAREKLSLLFENKELWEGEDVYNFFLDYFVGLLKININHAEEILDLFKERLGEGFIGTFKTLDKTIAYLKSRDEELLEKMFPEEREVVEGLLERIENEST